jgi:NADH-quinone oxidoreductase subunit E
MEIERIDQIINKYEGKESALIQILLDIQSENHWLPKNALDRVSEKLGVPINKVTNIATFHKTFSLVPKGKHDIHICNGTSCHARGAQKIIDTVEDITGITSGETDPDMKYSLKTVVCMGCCTAGPVVEVDGEYHANMEPSKVQVLLDDNK